MRKMINFIGVLFFVVGCSKDRTSQPSPSTTILLLKVDYTTTTFEGGYEHKVLGKINADSIPIKVDYKEPGDFGNISLYYQPSNSVLFDGSVAWMGRGEIKYPKTFDDASTYSHRETSLDKPADSRFQMIYGSSRQAIDYTSIWNSISKLEIVSDYIASDKKIGLFLYQPSIGMGDPRDWDWFVIMNK